MGGGLMARVAEENLLRLDAYSENVIEGKTVNLLAAFAEQAWRGLRAPVVGEGTRLAHYNLHNDQDGSEVKG